MIGCTASHYRQTGFDNFIQEFVELREHPDAKSFDRVSVRIKNLEVILVDHPDEIPYDHPGVVGLAVGLPRSYRIYILATKIGEKFYVNQAVLGHELLHVLHWRDKKIVDADQIDLELIRP